MPEHDQPQPSQPEESQGQPSRETPQTEEEKSLKEKFKDKLKDLKEKAIQAVTSRKEAHDKKPEGDKNKPQKAVQEAMANPKQYNVEQVFQQSSKLPEDTDVQLVLDDMIHAARDDEDYFDDASHLDKMSQWIMELQAIESSSGKTPESQQEARRFKHNLIRQYAEVVIDEIAKKEYVSQAQRDQKQKIAKEWAEEVGSELPPEALKEQLEEHKFRKKKEKEREKTQKLKSLYDEISSDDWNKLPTEVKQVVEHQRAYVDNGDYEGITRNIDEWQDTIGKSQMDHDLKLKLLEYFKKFRTEFSNAQSKDIISKIAPEIDQYKTEYDQALEELKSLESNLQRLDPTQEELENNKRSKRLEEIRKHTRFSENWKSTDGYGFEDPELGGQDTEQYREELNKLLLNERNLSDQDREFAQNLLDFLDARQKVKDAEKRYTDAMSHANQQIGREAMGKGRGSNIERFLENAKDREFLQQTLSNPEAALRLLSSPEEFDTFERNVLRVYNQIFASADINTDQQFENVFTQIYHAPAADEVVGHVDAVLAEVLTKRSSDTALVRSLNLLKNRLVEERNTRSYTHNVSYIISTRGSLEDLAGFSRRFRSSQLTAAFSEDMVRTAARLFEVKINQMLANNNWTIPTEFMQIDPELGEIRIDKETLDQLRKHYPDKEEWELRRAYRLARGLHLGASGVVLDRLGEADPPASYETGGFASYFGEKILPGWNPFRHIFHRFGVPPELADLVYAEVDPGATNRTWNYKSMKETMEKIQGLRGSKKVEAIAEMAGVPLIEVRNPFGVGSIMSRGGWRFEKATLHLLAPKEGVDEVNIGTGTNPEVRKKQVDWVTTWGRAKRVGPEIMKFFISKYGNDIAEALHPERFEGKSDDDKKKEHAAIKKEMQQDIFRHIRAINPLKFAHWEKEELFDDKLYQNSIRGRALIEVFGDDAKEFAKIESRASVLEDKLSLVQSAALRRAWDTWDKWEAGKVEEYDDDKNWGIKDEDYKILEKDPDIKDGDIQKVKDYVKALHHAIDTKKFRLIKTPNSFDRAGIDAHGHKKGTPQKPVDKMVGAIEYFAERDTNKLTMGTEDLDYSKLNFERAGQFIVERAFSDANHLSHAGNAMAGLPDTLIKANMGKSYEPLMEMLHHIHKPMEDYHGPEEASKAVRKMATVVIRFYDTNGWTHFLPAPFQQIAREVFRSSRVRERLGKSAWEWTADEKFGFIDALQASGVLTAADLKKLRKEVGADWNMVAVDYATMAAPIIIMLLLWQALSEALNESE